VFKQVPMIVSFELILIKLADSSRFYIYWYFPYELHFQIVTFLFFPKVMKLFVVLLNSKWLILSLRPSMYSLNFHSPFSNFQRMRFFSIASVPLNRRVSSKLREMLFIQSCDFLNFCTFYSSYCLGCPRNSLSSLIRASNYSTTYWSNCPTQFYGSLSNSPISCISLNCNCSVFLKESTKLSKTEWGINLDRHSLNYLSIFDTYSLIIETYFWT